MTLTETPALSATQITMLEAGLNHPDFVPTPKQRAANPSRLVDLGLIAPTSKGRYAITDAGRAAHQALALPLADSTPLKLTPLQVETLAKGMNTREFSLPGGKSTGQLVARGLLKPLSKGVYSLTDKGRAAHQAILSGHLKALDISEPLLDEVSGINLNDPALLEDRSEVTRWKQIAEDRLNKINQLNKTLDDMGQIADDLRGQMKATETLPDHSVEALRRDMLDAIGRLMNDDRTDLSMFDYYPSPKGLRRLRP